MCAIQLGVPITKSEAERLVKKFGAMYSDGVHRMDYAAFLRLFNCSSRVGQDRGRVDLFPMLFNLTYCLVAPLPLQPTSTYRRMHTGSSRKSYVNEWPQPCTGVCSCTHHVLYCFRITVPEPYSQHLTKAERQSQVKRAIKSKIERT